MDERFGSKCGLRGGPHQGGPRRPPAAHACSSPPTQIMNEQFSTKSERTQLGAKNLRLNRWETNSELWS